MAKKKTVVNKKFMLDLAKLIYDSKNRKFLRLCNGKLQNGPDPTDEKRPMHCGLGELYFAMTGRQPEEDNVGESDVTCLAADLARLPEDPDEDEVRQKVVENTIAKIKKLDLPKEIKGQLVDQAENLDIEVEVEGVRTRFVEALDEIPGINDDGCNDGSCSIEQYKERSKRVAKQFRKAAALLPK